MPHNQLEITRFLTDSALQCAFAVEIDPLPVNITKPFWKDLKSAIKNTFTDFPMSFVAAFKTVEGLSESIEYKQVNEINDMIPHKVPINISPALVTFRSGLAISDKLFMWYKMCRDWLPGNDDYRANISVVQLKKIPYLKFDLKLEVDRWVLPYAHVIKYSAPSYNSDDAKVSISEMQVICDRAIQKDYNVKYANEIALILKGYTQF
jgi:hypothetical protein